MKDYLKKAKAAQIMTMGSAVLLGIEPFRKSNSDKNYMPNKEYHVRIDSTDLPKPEWNQYIFEKAIGKK
jgi:hypothetical protein